MMATSSGPCDSPAVSTRSIALVSHDRLAHRGQDGRLVIEGNIDLAADEDPHLQEGLMQQHPEPRVGGAAGALPTPARAPSASVRRRRPAAVPPESASAAAAASGISASPGTVEIVRGTGACPGAVKGTGEHDDAERVAQRLERGDGGRSACHHLDVVGAEFGDRHDGGGCRRPGADDPHPVDALDARLAQCAHDAADIGVEAARAARTRGAAC